MKKYSQKELLSEGVWNALKNTARGVWRAGNYAMKAIAPQTHALLSTPKNFVKGMKSAVTGETNPGEVKVTPEVERSIKAGLTAANKKPSWRRIQYQSYDQASKRNIYSAYIVDPTTGKEQMIYVDSKGNQLQ